MSKKKWQSLLILMIFVFVTGIIFINKSYGEDDELQWIRQENIQQTDTVNEETETSVPTSIFVYICGYVTNPGVYELKQGARLYEGIAAAGGALADAGLDMINLAACLTDGERFYIPSFEEAEADAQKDISSEDVGININTASVSQLCALPGIGEAKATAIVNYREQNGSFGEIEDLLKVPGIKEGVFEQLRTLIRVN